MLHGVYDHEGVGTRQISASLTYAMSGGPWRHNGEAFIVIPYDGIGLATEVPIDTIALWVRVFDLSEFMTTQDYAKSFGSKLGNFMEYGGKVRNFLRFRVECPLSKPLKASFKLKIEGKVSMIPVKYKNVPHFCFVCGVIGHAKSNCENEELRSKGIRFGKEMQASPFKRRYNTRFTIPAAGMPVARNLNFAGGQQRATKTADVAKSAGISSKNPKHEATVKQDAGEVDGHDAEFKNDVEEQEQVVQVPPYVSNVLEAGVQDMKMDDANIGAIQLLPSASASASNSKFN